MRKPCLTVILPTDTFLIIIVVIIFVAVLIQVITIVTKEGKG